MEGLDHFDDNTGDTVFRDIIFLALAGFVAIVLLLLPHLNPPARAEAETNAPGNVIVELRWPDELNSDVDLWVEAPGDKPVGYSNKGGVSFNLLRDDLGNLADATRMNYEVSYSRGVPHGEYTVNVHLYRNLSGADSIPVTVVISVKPSEDAPAKQILATSVDLRHEGQEITAFRFSLDEKGRLISGSVHDLPRPLRSRKS
ncbi:hypothetical protein [Denitrobaculum tricleocarpae]|uniref:DUF2135 domain-containing protein n=1 Tax=Denitrobaculum tricleocarpae TaxID=2591009 RepID=A0A545TU98_9PROT|nr:hypothetical protein [Denitrobaculum tricleocarpae]TQV80796.1 hypothetical protein FKG95_11650 [Denitrobaculum tricleocarpae]